MSGFYVQLVAQHTDIVMDSTKMEDLLDADLDKLLSMKISVSTIEEKSIRETASIISVITAEDIRRLGARDLIDVLQLVPGFEFGSDVANYTGLGLRGIWASEGKISVYVDGHEFNDLLYGNVPFGNHFPIESIKQIEIIRGPGSAMYGGSSQLGVIRIQTFSGDLTGIRAVAKVGAMGNSFSDKNPSLITRNDFSLQAGSQEHKVKYYVSANFKKALRSTKDYHDFATGVPASMKDNSYLTNYNLIGQVSYQKLVLKVLYDKYTQQNIDALGNVYPKPILVNFFTFSSILSYEKNFGHKFILKPFVNLKVQNPGSVIDSVKSGYIFDTKTVRFQPRLDAIYKPTDKINILAGTQYTHDKAEVVHDRYTSNPAYYRVPLNYFGNSCIIENWAAYTQTEIDTKIVNLTIGGRYEKSSLGYSAAVPRLGITKIYKNFHAKLMGAQSYRVPFIKNISTPDIKPEKASIYELEVGYKLRKTLFVTVNLYSITVDNALLYINETKGGSYQNAGYIGGTNGIESELHYKYRYTSFNLNYSYYRADENSAANPFGITKQDFANGDVSQSVTQHYLQGFAPHKVSASISHTLFRRLSLNLNGVFYSKRYGFNQYDAGLNRPVMKEFAPSVLLNAFVNYSNIYNKGLDIGFGVYNIGDSQYAYITPYNAAHGAIPVGGTEYVLRIAVNVGNPAR